MVLLSLGLNLICNGRVMVSYKVGNNAAVATCKSIRCAGVSESSARVNAGWVCSWNATCSPNTMPDAALHRIA